jgi:hypothetical protein
VSERFPWLQVGRYAPFAFLGGGFIGFLIRGLRWETRSFLHGGIIGFTCFAFAVAGERIFNRWIEAAPQQWWRRALIYFAGSQIGWPLGLFLGLPLVWGVPLGSIHMPRSVWFVVIICSAIGTLAGMAVYGYEALKERQPKSIEKLN